MVRQHERRLGDGQSGLHSRCCVHCIGVGAGSTEQRAGLLSTAASNGGGSGGRDVQTTQPIKRRRLRKMQGDGRRR